MIFAADIGNTSISLGIYEKGKLLTFSRLLTERKMTSEEYISLLEKILQEKSLNDKSFSGSVVSSVVPEVTENFISALSFITSTDPIIVGEKHNGNLRVDILPVSYLGADLIAGSVGAIKKYPLPCIVADLGTATKLLVLDREGCFRGCTISPGVKISLEALGERASLLPDISLQKPERVIGENTEECMQSGIVFGTAAMLDGLVSRIKAELDEKEVTVVATGGYSKEIASCCETDIIYDENLLLDGLLEIYELSKKN